MIAGESIGKAVSEELTYKELYDNVENLWSILFTTGYLTQRGEAEGERVQLVLNCVNSSEYAPAVYVICKPHETRRSTTTPSFRGIHI